MTGPVNFNPFLNRLLGPENLYELEGLDKDKGDKNQPVQDVQDKQQAALQMNVGEDQEPELDLGAIDLSAMDPEKFRKDLQ